MRRDGESGYAVEVRELGIPMGSLEGMSSSKRRDVHPLSTAPAANLINPLAANVRGVDAVGMVSHEVAWYPLPPLVPGPPFSVLSRKGRISPRTEMQ